MNVTQVTIDECEDTECEKCRETKEDVVSLAIELEAGDVVIFLCQGCLVDAIGAAVDDGLSTKMIDKK